MRVPPTAAASAFLGLLLLASCSGDNQPCTQCPPVEGLYILQADAPDQTCPKVVTPPNSIALSREGSTLRAVLPEGVLTGTLYDTFDFTLHGTLGGGGTDGGTDGGFVGSPGPTTAVDLRARYINGSDGGADRFSG